MPRSAILAVFLAVTVLAGCKSTSADDEQVPEEELPPAIVFTQERSTSEDVIYLRDEKELRGQVMDTLLSVSTAYGELSIAADRCARAAFFEDEEAEEDTWIQVIITVNDNRITGANTEPTIRFKDSESGEETEVEKKDIWFIAFQQGSDELSFVDAENPPDQFIMSNGDLLTGHATETDLMIETDDGEVAIPFAEIATVRLLSEDDVDETDTDEEAAVDADEEVEDVPKKTTAIVTKRDRDVVRGLLVTEQMSLNLDLELTIEGIAKDKFGRIHTSGGEVVTCSNGMEMVLIPAGEFTMGSPADEERRDDDETQRQVILTSGFSMSAMEVTQGEWVAVMGEYSSEFKGGLRPVERVSWEEAAEYCNGLSIEEGLPVAYEIKDVEDVKKVSFLDAQGQPTTDVTQVKGYRLPTDAEWEYACRAGTTTVFNVGDTISTDQANFNGGGTYGGSSTGDALESTVQVGSYPANAWGLYDMHGNVWEWCHDLHGTYSSEAVTDPSGATPGTSSVPRGARVLRGGGWSGDPVHCRSAYRAWASPTTRDRYLGFRVVLDMD